MTKRYIIEREALTGGLNDTPFPSNRHLSQAKEFKHIRPQKDFSLEKIKGRKTKYFGFTGSPYSLIKIPQEKEIIELTQFNNTLKFLYGATDYTATLSTGKYYTYSDLASALQTALNNAVGSSVFTVSYDSSTRKFTISANNIFILYWYHDDTTLDRTLFGFNWSVSTGGYPYSVQSEFAVEKEPPNDILWTQSDKVVNQDSTEIKFPDGDSLESSDKWSGIWHNQRYYASNGEYFLIQDNKEEFRKNLKEYTQDIAYIDYLTYNSLLTMPDFQNLPDPPDTDYAELDVNNPRIRYFIGNASHTRLYDYLKLRLYATIEQYDFEFRIYQEIPETGEKELLKSIPAQELPTGSFTEQTYELEYLFRGDGRNNYLILEFYTYSSSSESNIRINLVVDNEDSYELGDSDGLWNPQSGYGLYGELGMAKYSKDDSDTLKYKISFVNKLGFETELSPEFTHPSTFTNSYIFLRIFLPNHNWEKYDLEYIRLYRTTLNGNIYYKLIDIPRNFLENLSGTNQVIELEETFPDSRLQEHAEADVITTRSGIDPYKYSCWWQERHWVAGVSDSEDVVYWSKANTPESFDLSTNWIKVGVDGSPITGLIPLGDRLLVFKENSIFIFYPSGTAFGLTDLKQKGIGTRSHWSLVSAFTNEGSAVFFQGQDGHFYATDGIKLTNISAGRLDETINSLNLNALDQTYAIYDDYNHEIIWSVCTGTNTSPDLNIVYNLDKNSFHTETMPANIWTKYTDKNTGKIIILGASSDKIFERENDNADLDNDISMVWETADYDCGEPETEKSFIALYIYAYGENSNQELSISWYINESSNAEGTHTLDLTTSATEHRIPINGRGKKIRFKFTNTDQLGKVKIGRLVIEYQPIGVIKR